MKCQRVLVRKSGETEFARRGFCAFHSASLSGRFIFGQRDRKFAVGEGIQVSNSFDAFVLVHITVIGQVLELYIASCTVEPKTQVDRGEMLHMFEGGGE